MKYTYSPIYKSESEKLIKTHRKDTICNMLYAIVDWHKPDSKQNNNNFISAYHGYLS